MCTCNNDADDVNDRSFLVALHRANDTTGKGNTLLVPFGIAFQKKQCLVRYLNISPPRHRVAFLYLRFSCKPFFAPLGRTRATSTHTDSVHRLLLPTFVLRLPPNYPQGIRKVLAIAGSNARFHFPRSVRKPPFDSRKIFTVEI